MSIWVLALVLSTGELPASPQSERTANAPAIARHLRQENFEQAQHLFELNGKSLKHPISRIDFNDVLSELAFLLSESQGYGGTLTGIRWCYERGADVNALKGRPIWTAAKRDRYEKGLLRLLEYGADPNLSDPERGTPLVAAMKGLRPDNALTLLQHKADPNLLSGKERSLPLAVAVRLNKIQLIYEFVRYYKMNVNAREPKGNNTALHVAVLARNETACTALMELGANETLKDAKGRTPLQLAQQLGYKEIVKTLKVMIAQERAKRKKNKPGQ